MQWYKRVKRTAPGMPASAKAQTAGSALPVSPMPGVTPRRRMIPVNEETQTANPAVCATGGGRCYLPFFE